LSLGVFNKSISWAYPFELNMPTNTRPLNSTLLLRNNVSMRCSCVIFGTGWDGVDWLYQTEQWNQWRVLMNTVMNFGFYERRGISWLTEQLSESHKGVSCTEIAAYSQWQNITLQDTFELSNTEID
jgi:hypothetical protein